MNTQPKNASTDTDTIAIERPEGVKVRSTFVTEAPADAAPAARGEIEQELQRKSEGSASPTQNGSAKPGFTDAEIDETANSVREQILEEASEKISNTRRAEYGDAQQSFERIAALWTARELYLPGARTYTTADVAVMLGLLKVARLSHQPAHRDSWVDLVGYAALGAEVTITEEKN